MAVSRLIRNQGVEAAPTFRYGYFLSTSRSNPDHIQLSVGSGALPTGAESFDVDQILVPLDVPAGQYFLSLILDPGGDVVETDETNNVVEGPAITMLDAPIVFVNERLPPATIGIEYEVGLFARGGALPLSISISSGQLPNNLMLDANGWISGTPDTEEIQTFTVRATASGQAFAEKVFRLRVGPPTIDLTVATEYLPAAFARTPYDVQLLAAGGAGGYVWATDSVLPEGMMLRPNGRLTGTPLVAGEYSLTASVTDELSDIASRTLALFVVTPRQLVKIRQTTLPNGTVGDGYCTNDIVFLLADRGFPPYTWSTVSGEIPGLTLSSDGQLCGTPTASGTFGIVARVSDRTRLFDTSHVFVTVEAGRSLAVSTFELHDAILDEDYSANVSAVRGTPPYSFTVTGGDTPPGLTMDMNGAINGTATSTGTYAFLVTVEDDEQRTALQALSIRVKFESEDSTGCNCAAHSIRDSRTSLLALPLMILAGLLLRRRRTH